MKLEIPAPGESTRQDSSALADELWIGIVLSALVAFFGWFLWIEPQRVAEEEPYADVEDEEERQYLRDLAVFEDMVRLETMDRVDWHEEQDRAARLFEIGPRQATEIVCEEYRAEPGLGRLPQSVSRALLQRVSRRSHDAPWTCLSDAYWSGELPEDREIFTEVAAFWEEAQSLERHGRLMDGVVRELLYRNALPDDDRFRSWVKRCALAMEYGAVTACQQVLEELSPRLGEDILLTALAMLDDPQLSEGDLDLVIDALAHLARYGQPDAWTILETAQLPDYDVDFRLGALFQLCRLMHIPDEDIHFQVARGLGRVSGYAVSPTTPHLRYRWRSSCRLAFGDPDRPDRPVDLLHVAHETDDGEEVLELGLRGAVEHGHCEVEEGLPLWFCGARRWTGGNRTIQTVLGDYFALTAHANWYELDYLPQDWADSSRSADGE